MTMTAGARTGFHALSHAYITWQAFHRREQRPGGVHPDNVGASLQDALRPWRTPTPERRQRFHILHISTDEVFGSLGTSGLSSEETAHAPNSPCSASKTASDHLVRDWRRSALSRDGN
ncbi:GDP-mannose 4,6-dehydratase [Bradyrhizobium xenonodulans]|uniref:GDP-mannose 4,6-dehydratase n=1 Tax=Bradyrhizobium xenonodulans TaxID=2736875 RepID=UPI00351ECBBC